MTFIKIALKAELQGAIRQDVASRSVKFALSGGNASHSTTGSRPTTATGGIRTELLEATLTHNSDIGRTTAADIKI